MGTATVAMILNGLGFSNRWPYLVAVGHSVLVAISYLLTRKEPSHELGAQYFDEHERDHVERRLVHRLERLGFVVTLETLPEPS